MNTSPSSEIPERLQTLVMLRALGELDEGELRELDALLRDRPDVAAIAAEWLSISAALTGNQPLTAHLLKPFQNGGWRNLQ